MAHTLDELKSSPNFYPTQVTDLSFDEIENLVSSFDEETAQNKYKVAERCTQRLSRERNEKYEWYVRLLNYQRGFTHSRPVRPDLVFESDIERQERYED